MGHTKRKKLNYRSLIISLIISAVILICGIVFIDTIKPELLVKKLLFPLSRLMVYITIGLIAGQVLEASGWTKYLAMLASPLFRFGKLGKHSSAAFTTAFISGVAANAMLLEFYQEKIITKKQLFLSNFVNQFPAYFLHLPTTFFIVIPLTGRAGIIYFALTFTATVLRTILFLTYGFFTLKDDVKANGVKSAEKKKKADQGILSGIKKKLPARVINIAVFVLPIYIAVFMLNHLGMFKALNELMSRYVVTTFIPMESLSVVILSFAAEFTSGFAAAGALMDAGVLSVKQTAIALIAGNILAFPIRALRHQLPRYIGIYSPKMGTQLLLMGQFFRILSLIFVTIVFFYFF